MFDAINGLEDGSVLDGSPLSTVRAVEATGFVGLKAEHTRVDLMIQPLPR